MAWPPRGLDDGDAVVGNMAAQAAGGDDAVAQIVGIEDLFQANGDRVQVAAGEATVSGEAFGQNEQVGFLLGHPVVVATEKTADVGEGVLLGGEGAAVGQRENLLRSEERRVGK